MSVTKSLPLGPTVSVRELATQTASLSFRDLYLQKVLTKSLLNRDAVLTTASVNATARVNDKLKVVSNDASEQAAMAKEISSVGYTITWTDIENALGGLKSNQSSAIGAPKVITAYSGCLQYLDS
jgi:hypothetical protein